MEYESFINICTGFPGVNPSEREKKRIGRGKLWMKMKKDGS